jgi:hypothetical protein
MRGDEEKMPRRFNKRAFVAMAMALSGGGLPVTGILNHVRQTDPMTSRHLWMAAHDSLGLLFVVFATWHVVLNWKTLARYVRGGARQLVSASLEAAWATAVVIGIVGLAIGHTLH